MSDIPQNHPENPTEEVSMELYRDNINLPVFTFNVFGVHETIKVAEMFRDHINSNNLPPSDVTLIYNITDSKFGKLNSLIPTAKDKAAGKSLEILKETGVRKIAVVIDAHNMFRDGLNKFVFSPMVKFLPKTQIRAFESIEKVMEYSWNQE